MAIAGRDTAMRSSTSRRPRDHFVGLHPHVVGVHFPNHELPRPVRDGSGIDLCLATGHPGVPQIGVLHPTTQIVHPGRQGRDGLPPADRVLQVELPVDVHEPREPVGHHRVPQGVRAVVVRLQ
jgi:hypothetical protein